MPIVPTPAAARYSAAGAVEDRRLVLARQAVLGPLLEVALRHERRARQVALVPLVLLADVAQLHVALQELLDLLRRRFLDVLLQLGEVVAIAPHRPSRITTAASPKFLS